MQLPFLFFAVFSVSPIAIADAPTKNQAQDSVSETASAPKPGHAPSARPHRSAELGNAHIPGMMGADRNGSTESGATTDSNGYKQTR